MKNTFKAKKKFGQNFLNSELVADKIANIITLKNQNVLEVGCGNLALTKHLLKKMPKKFLGIEIDKDIVKKNTINNLKESRYILNTDALTFDENKYFKNKSFIVISNLPFNISSKLLIKWIKIQNKYHCIKAMVLMFQKELGERIISEFNSKQYGRLSILAQSTFCINKEIDVKKENFIPIPQVDAVVIKFTPLKKAYEVNFNNLEKITNFFFNTRRKKNEKKIKKLFNKDQIKKNNLDILYNLRAENISKEIYYKMSNLI